MAYKIMLGGVSFTLNTGNCDFHIEDEFKPISGEDVLKYTFDEDTLTYHAQILNPSAHTRYLLDQGKLYFCVSVMHPTWPRTNASNYHEIWTSDWRDKVLDLENIQIKANDILLVKPRKISDILWWADDYKNPPRDKYFIKFKFGLGSRVCNDDSFTMIDNVRWYKSFKESDGIHSIWFTHPGNNVIEVK